MKVILLQNVKNLGVAGEVKEVSEGYVRNFLQPQKLAEVASASAIAAIARREEEKRKKAEAQRARMQEMVVTIRKLGLTLAREADVKGTLYAAISPKDIVAKLKEYKCEVAEGHVHTDGHIKKTGDYMVRISPEPGIEGVLKLKVVRKL